MSVKHTDSKNPETSGYIVSGKSAKIIYDKLINPTEEERKKNLQNHIKLFNKVNN